MATRYQLWDVVVVGGGPAGAIAARQLALQGRRVLLVEKSAFPRFKVCGGCLGGEALRVLREVGLEDLPVKLGGVVLRTMRLRSEGSTIDLELGHRVGISRRTFDASLLQKAEAAGATVCLQTHGRLLPFHDLRSRPVELRHARERATVEAKAVLLATGLSSCPPEFATRSWTKSRIGLGTVVEPGQLGFNDLLRMSCSSAGYVGIAPVEQGRYVVAAAVDPTALAAAHSPGKLVEQIVRTSDLPSRLNLEGADWRGTPPLTRQTRPLAAHRCLLIGDAAEYVEPFTGEGIGWAMRSAVLASSLIQEGLEAWDERIAQRWETVYTRSLAGQQLRCRWISQLLLRGRHLRRLTLWSLRQAPILARPFV